MTDFDAWQKHVAQVVADEGRWVGLGTGDGVPLMRLPLETLNARRRVQDTGDGELMMPTIGSYGQTHLAVQEELAAPVDDGTGRLIPQTEPGMVIVADQGGKRGYPTTHPDGDAHPEAPRSLRVPYEDMVGLLASWPCPSIPMTWKANSTSTWTEDAGTSYDTPRRYAAVEMATKADGFTVVGEAIATIRDVIQDSLDAVNTLKGWVGDEHLVVDYATFTPTDKTVSIRTDDRMVLETVQPWAQDAGIDLSVDLWWPGDDPVTVRLDRSGDTETRSWDRPIGVVRVKEMGA